MTFSDTKETIADEKISLSVSPRLDGQFASLASRPHLRTQVPRRLTQLVWKRSNCR
jgi:hypothetical protein